MKPIGFFAYSSKISSCEACIEEAMALINSTHEDSGLYSWRELNISGNFVISKVVDAIDNSDFFCADLTGVNDNVLFELGYAIAKRKPLFLIQDTSIDESFRRFKELGLLETVGYNSYTNPKNILDSYNNTKPYAFVGEPLLEVLLKTIEHTEARVPLLILSTQVDTIYDQEVINQAQYFKLPYILDDATENKVQPLSWYIHHLKRVPALLSQFSTTNRTGYQIQNAKCSLISGIALGLGLKVKMIAEEPYTSPLDFKEVLQKFNTRTECINVVAEFLKFIKPDIAELLINTENLREIKRKRSKLQNINFGEAIAEHEISKLQEYYVETTNLASLMKNEYNIVIGRKGTGKSAALFHIENESLKEKINHVVLIKPVNFEVDGLISLMESSNNEFEKGYLVECIWKFLIYSEIAKKLYEEIKSKPLYALKKDDTEFIKYIEGRSTLFLTDFSTRLEEQVDKLKEENVSDIGDGKNHEFRVKVSEILHQKILSELIIYFSKIVPKNHRLIVLIDNLDKSWRTGTKITILSKYILGLLGVSGRIKKELSFIKLTKTSLSFHLTIFLRSDIYRHIIQFAREPDKIEITKLNWNDPEMLYRIIEERFIELSGQAYTATDLWKRFITNKVDNKEVKEYIMDAILPRPRDMIYFFKAAKDFAVSRGHEKIEADDIKRAYKEYSGWVFKSLIVENGITFEQMESFMYELMSSNYILSKGEIKEKMQAAGIANSTENALEKFIDYLVDLTILGREIKKGQFEFDYDIDSSKRLKKLSEKLGSNRYKIHNALLPFLECTID